MKTNDIVKCIKDNKEFAIVTHVNPDGDALGSSFAFKRCLENNGKKADIYISADHLPVRYGFLSEGHSHFTGIDKDKKYDCIVCLDCASIKRLGSLQDLTECGNTILNIDHHKTNDGFGDLNLIEEDAASTGEIVFELIKASGWKIDAYTANALFTAVSTDTGRFAFESVSKKTFLTVAELCDSGLDIPFVSNEVFFSRSLDATLMYSKLISNMELLFDGSVAVSYITWDDIKGMNIEGSDYENAIDVIREIRGVNVAVFIRQLNENYFKVSFRSKKDVDVSEIASVFGGGGHVRAAGCSVAGELFDVRDRVIDVLKGYV